MDADAMTTQKKVDKGKARVIDAPEGLIESPAPSVCTLFLLYNLLTRTSSAFARDRRWWRFAMKVAPLGYIISFILSKLLTHSSSALHA